MPGVSGVPPKPQELLNQLQKSKSTEKPQEEVEQVPDLSEFTRIPIHYTSGIEATYKPGKSGTAGYLKMKSEDGTTKIYKVTVWHTGQQVSFNQSEWSQIADLALGVIKNMGKLKETEGRAAEIEMNKQAELTASGLKTEERAVAYKDATTQKMWSDLLALITGIYQRESKKVVIEEVKSETQPTESAKTSTKDPVGQKELQDRLEGIKRGVGKKKAAPQPPMPDKITITSSDSFAK